MDILDEGLFTVIQRFPEWKLRIDKLYVSNEDFKLLCADYHVCVTTLSRMIRDAGQNNEVGEYKSLKLSLEKEIINYLDSSPTGLGDSGI